MALNKRCVVIFGKTGHGKSSLANALFSLEGNDTLFDEDDSPTRVTLAPQSHTAMVGDVRLRVIDTPGLFDQEMTLHRRWPDILEAIALGQPGIDAVIVVVDAGQLYSGANVMNLIQECIGPKICGRVIICFTKQRKSRKTKEDIIVEFNRNLQKGILGCFWVFHDKGDDKATQKKTREAILEYVEEIHNSGFRQIEKEHFMEYTKTYFKSSIESLTSEVSLDNLRNSNTIKIELLEMFLTRDFMGEVITLQNTKIYQQREVEKARQKEAEEARRRSENSCVLL